MPVVLEELKSIAIKDLVFDDQNPRRDVGDITELRDSIRERGVIEPIVVRPVNGHYSVVAGRRRWAAATAAGLTEIPSIVRPLTDEEAAAAALVENLQRKDLSPLEEARGYRAWLDLTKRSQAELARAVGKAPSTVANALRVLDAPKLVQDALASGAITAAHAKTALELRSPSLASALKLKPGISVDELHDQVRRANDEYDTKGDGARETLRKALAEAQAKYPNATITWKPAGYDVVSTIATLGKPPAAIVGEIGPHTYPTVTVEKHDKACTCRAYELDVRVAWSGQRKVVTELRRVCIDKKGYAAAKPKQKKAPRTRTSTTTAKAPKPLTPEQQAKRAAVARKTAERAVTKELAIPTARTQKGAPIFKKLKGSIATDVARALAYVDFVVDGYFGRGVDQILAQQIAWERIAKMPAKKISALAAASVAKRVEDELVNVRHWAPKGEDAEAAPRIVAAYFGVKVAAPKAKKARR